VSNVSPVVKLFNCVIAGVGKLACLHVSHSTLSLKQNQTLHLPRNGKEVLTEGK